jgi:cytochrome bd-type quinol oxidase subunit 2
MNLSADLNTVWFVLLGLLFTGYVVLDGFDLGVRARHRVGLRAVRGTGAGLSSASA